MPKPVVFLADALTEVEAAASWYGERDPEVAGAFLVELDRALESVAARPATWSAHLHGTRRYRLRRFPFALVFRELQEAVVVLVVAHERRKPGYWRTRGHR